MPFSEAPVEVVIIVDEVVLWCYFDSTGVLYIPVDEVV